MVHTHSPPRPTASPMPRSPPQPLPLLPLSPTTASTHAVAPPRSRAIAGTRWRRGQALRPTACHRQASQAGAGWQGGGGGTMEQKKTDKSLHQRHAQTHTEEDRHAATRTPNRTIQHNTAQHNSKQAPTQTKTKAQQIITTANKNRQNSQHSHYHLGKFGNWLPPSAAHRTWTAKDASVLVTAASTAANRASCRSTSARPASSDLNAGWQGDEG
jgi:hypothetical protein